MSRRNRAHRKAGVPLWSPGFVAQWEAAEYAAAGTAGSWPGRRKGAGAGRNYLAALGTFLSVVKLMTL